MCLISYLKKRVYFVGTCFGLLLFIFVMFPSCNYESEVRSKKTEYRCLPCGSDCDNEIFKDSGYCSTCKMKLVEAGTINFTTIQPSQICEYIKAHPGTLLVDVRTKEEFEGRAEPNFGTLKNSINIPIQELQSRLLEIDNYKNNEIIVFCSHSHRSPQAAYLLNQNGFKKVVNMAGGMSKMERKDCVQW